MTIKTIKPSGGDYSTLSAWVSSLSAVLSAPQQADIYNFGSGGLVESGGVPISGFTTTTTNRIIINVPTAERHNGLAHSGAYITNAAAGFSVTTLRFGSNVDFVEVHGLEVESLDTAGGAAFHWNLACGASNEYVMTHCLIHGAANTGVVAAFAANGNYIYRNNIMYSPGSQRVFDTRGVTSMEFSNNTVYAVVDFPFLCDNNVSNVVKNTYVGGATNLCFHGSFCGTGNNNAASDTSATANFTSSVNSIAGSSAFTSVTSGSEDFRTKTGFTALNNLGATLAAVTDDIIGTARPQGSAYDIGAFENIVAGGGFIPGWATGTTRTIGGIF